MSLKLCTARAAVRHVGCIAAILMVTAISPSLAQSGGQATAVELGAMSWVAGTWTGHQGEPAPAGFDVLMDVHWTPNGQALQMDLTTVHSTASQPFMSALYYWHPGTRVITMLQILSGGTVNDGRVVAASDSGLTQELHATDASGTTHLLRTEFVREGADQFRFISSLRASDQAPWISSAPIQFTRKSSKKE